ncbi:MAG: two-component system OmpR family response regulator [Cyclobacteriaceae bacterium]|jgi:two-component system OmpR family response regulator
MKTDQKIKLFLVDDDALYLKSMEIDFLEIGEYTVETFATGELCLQNIALNPDIIILDYHLNAIDKTAINGLETLDKIKVINPNIPVVILSSQDRIEVAVNCMHHKAFDYVVKNETAFMRIQKIIDLILKLHKIQTELKWYMDRV